MLLGLSLKGLLSALNNSSPDGSPMTTQEGTISMLIFLETFKQYFIPIVAILGIIGNAISTMVLLQKNLKKRPTAHFLAAKCISDAMFLVCLFLQTIGVMQQGSGLWCHFLSMVTQASNFQSTWYVVGMATDRYLVICLPVWTHVHCCRGNKPLTDIRHQHSTTVTWAKTAIICISFVALAVYLNLSLMVGVVAIGGQPTCVPLFAFLTAFQVLGYLDIIINVIIPYSAVCVLVLLTMKTVIRFYIYRKRVINNTGSSNTVHYPKTELRQAKIIAIFCLVQLLSVSPTHILRIYHTVRHLLGLGQGLQLDQFFLQHVFQLIYFSSFAINFILLLCCDRIFRKVLRLMWVSILTRCGYICRSKNETFPVGAMTFALEFSSALVRMNETGLL